MNTYRKNSIIAGTLYIVATVAGVLSAIVSAPFLEKPLNLSRIAANKSDVLMAALFISIMGIAVAGIAIWLYPILKKVDPALAFAFVTTRIVEGTLFFVGTVSLLLLLPLSQEFVNEGAPAASFFQTIGNFTASASDITIYIGMTVFCLGALMLYYMLYQTKLVPTWLSIWGGIGILMMLVSNILYLSGYSLSPSETGALNGPIALQEMVLAVWIIVKGFDSERVDNLQIKES
jgi:hypothetical protein